MTCDICPRRCHADRSTSTGYCGAPEAIKIARAAPHFWEEPCISGYMGTGAVFFSGCNLRCSFCQNYEISTGATGWTVTEQELADIFRQLETEEQCHSISLVTGSHYIPQIVRAMDLYGGNLPFVFNCGGYESVDSLKLLEGRVKIYLPDLKYSDPDLAARLSHAPDYFERAKAAILEMYRQVGDYELDHEGLIRKGVVIRHLLLPDQTVNTFGVLDWIADTFRPGQVLVSLMAQYTPYGPAKDIPPFNRTITPAEYHKAVSYMEALGIEDGFYQEPESASTSFIPEFYDSPNLSL